MWPLVLCNICLLRANPQDLPASNGLLALTLLAYYIADVVTVSTLVPPGQALMAAAADVALIGALTLLALGVRQLTARAVQTLTALTGCGVLMGMITAVIGILLPPEISPLYLTVPALLWLLAVYGHVLRHALDVPYVTGVFATGAYLALLLVVVRPFLIAPEVAN